MSDKRPKKSLVSRLQEIAAYGRAGETPAHRRGRAAAQIVRDVETLKRNNKNPNKYDPNFDEEKAQTVIDKGKGVINAAQTQIDRQTTDSNNK